MRIAPIALLYFDKDEKLLRDVAYKATEITHTHPLGLEGSAILDYSISLVLRGRITQKLDINEFIEKF